ncbi:MAG: hypothetical protein GY757_40205 [bacterium]|nr:hypothetical protein [bacterium]
MTKRFSTLILPMLFVFVLATFMASPLTAKENQHSFVHINPFYSVNGTYELAPSVVNSEKIKDTLKLIKMMSKIPRHNIRPPFDGGVIPLLKGYVNVLTQLGDSATITADFGDYGRLEYKMEVIDVEQLTYELRVDGALNGIPEVEIPVRRAGEDFTWLPNGQAYGIATFVATTTEGNQLNMPVTYTIEYKAKKPGIELPARFAGNSVLEKIDEEAMEAYGTSECVQVEVPFKLS